jgi:hypothetical protein
LNGVGAALQSIRHASVEQVGFEKSIELPMLDKLVREMAELARGALVARGPSLAPRRQSCASLTKGLSTHARPACVLFVSLSASKVASGTDGKSNSLGSRRR